MSQPFVIFGGNGGGGGASSWDTILNAAANLTLSNAGFSTTFNQTSAVIWKWANTMAATAAGVVSSSPTLQLGGRLFTSGLDTAAAWSIQNVMSPSSAATFTVTNLSENSSSTVVATIGTHTLVVGNWVTLSGITGTFSYLNGVNVPVTVIAATTFSFQDPTLHGTQGSAASNGTVTQIPATQLQVTQSGSVGPQMLVLPPGSIASVAGFYPGFQFTGQPAHTGFGLSSTVSGGLVAALNTAITANVLDIRIGGAGTMTQRAVITIGDNGVANSALEINTTTAGWGVSIQGKSNTATGSPGYGVALGNGTTSFTPPSGNMVGVAIGLGKQSANAIVFAPTSGTATFQSLLNKYTVNQTGGANGAVTGLQITAVETAVGGTHKLIDLLAGSAGTTELFSIDNVGTETSYTPNGAQWVRGSASELLTLSTVGLTTDTSANLLPAGAVIEAVVCRVTTTITTTTNWAVGDANVSNRFSSANATLTSATTAVGINHFAGSVTTDNAGPTQSAAAKVRITCTGANPGAGAIRITVFYRQFVAPTS
jgi:hypothetical protein